MGTKYEGLTEAESAFCDASVSGVVQHATTKKLRINSIDGIREAIATALIDGRPPQTPQAEGEKAQAGDPANA